MRYILVNKPYEVLTQFTDEHGRATLKQFVPLPGIYPVGRLDYDSEGLVLLTDDKPLQHRLSDPKFKVPKTYWAQVEGVPTEEQLQKLRRGVPLKDGLMTPAQADLLPEPTALPPRSTPIRYRASIPTSWLRLTISQGKNRQVRRMTAAVGLPCLRLLRVSIAFLTLDSLAPGEWRELTEAEAKKLKAAFSASKNPAQRGPLPKAGGAAATHAARPDPTAAAVRTAPKPAASGRRNG
ncbi:pseudouridine synthase [uncultured Hymenobacter sp.]|uniref:pseudouridine synthase n=1 Tax=uncultured Hymenobacter sp. TaxID=170016 RepID=UPI0035C9B891